MNVSDQNKWKSYSLSASIAEIFSQASRTGHLSYADYCLLSVTRTAGMLSPEEKEAVERVAYGIRRGTIRMALVPEDSTPFS